MLLTIKGIDRWTPNAFIQEIAMNNSPACREGYLFKKIVPKIGPVIWKKRFFVLQNGRLSYNFLPSPSKNSHTVVSTESLNVLLCSVRPLKNEERRFCFEIINPKRYFLPCPFILILRKSWILQGLL